MASQTPLADEISRISREEFDRYIQDFRPTEQATITSLNDSTVGKAMDDSGADSVRARASLGRMRERYGTDTTPTQAAAESRQASLGGVLNSVGAGNAAALGDRDRKQQTLTGLLNHGQGLRQQAMGNFGSASSLEGARASANSANKNAYQQSKAADKQQTYQSAAALASTAAMVMMM
jgi:hypothetical protein